MDAGEVKINVAPAIDMAAFARDLRSLGDQLDPDGAGAPYRLGYETGLAEREALRRKLDLEIAVSCDNASRWADEQAKRIAAEKALQQAMTGLEVERQRSRQMGEAFMQLHNLAKAVVGPARA